MPLYEYRCTECDRQFELMQKFSEEPLKECIYCGGQVNKLISLSSFHLKGSGWYLTDYARKKDTGKEGQTGSCAEKKKNCGESC